MNENVRLTRQLALQLLFIANSCALYDQGVEDEAVRIAVALRTLFYTNPRPKSRSISLLKQLGREGVSLFSSVADPGSPINLIKQEIRLNPPSTRAIPQLEGAVLTLRSFGQWWALEPVYILPGHGALTRCALTLTVCNKDGGTHVDDLPPHYEKLIAGEYFLQLDPRNLVWKEDERPPQADEIQTVKNAHLAALRQIGFEVMKSSFFRAI